MIQCIGSTGILYIQVWTDLSLYTSSDLIYFYCIFNFNYEATLCATAEHYKMYSMYNNGTMQTDSGTKNHWKPSLTRYNTAITPALVGLAMSVAHNLPGGSSESTLHACTSVSHTLPARSWGTGVSDMREGGAERCGGELCRSGGELCRRGGDRFSFSEHRRTPLVTQRGS